MADNFLKKIARPGPEVGVKHDVKGEGSLITMQRRAAGMGDRLGDGLEIMKHAEKSMRSTTSQTCGNYGDVLPSGPKKKKKIGLTKMLGKLRSQAETLENVIGSLTAETKSETAKSMFRSLSNSVINLLFLDSALIHHSLVAFGLCSSAWLGMSVAWSFLIWLALDGAFVLMLSEKEVSMLYGIPTMPAGHEPTFAMVNQRSETVAWFNFAVSLLWSRLREFIEDDVRNTINKLIKKKLKEWKEGFLLQHLIPSVQELNIGGAAPWITSIQSYSKEADYVNSSNPSITVDFGIGIHLKTSFSLNVSRFFPMRLEEFKMSLPLRVRFSPLLRDRQAFGQIHLSLLHEPTFDYQTRGYLLFLSFPFIKHAIRSVIRKALRTILYPRKIRIPNPSINNFQDHMVLPTRPLGTLRLNIIEGDEMKPTNYPNHCTCLANGEPYVVAQLGPTAVQTPVIHANLSPKWNFRHEFPITHQDFVYRQFKLIAKDFDWGFWNPDDDIGFTMLSVKKVVEKRFIQGWYWLCSHGGGGALHVSLEFIPIMEKLPPKLALMNNPDVFKSQAILSILVHEVDMEYPLVPMIVLDLSGRETVTTSPGYLAENWEFMEEFLLPVQDVELDKIMITLVDYGARVSFFQKMSKFVANFLKESEEPQMVRKFNRDNHFAVGSTTLYLLSDITGHRQKIVLHTRKGVECKVILTAQLYYLDNDKRQSSKDLWYLRHGCRLHPDTTEVKKKLRE